MARVSMRFRYSEMHEMHCIQSYFDSLRAELQDRVQVLCVQPGYVATSLGVNALSGSGLRTADADKLDAKAILKKLGMSSG